MSAGASGSSSAPVSATLSFRPAEIAHINHIGTGDLNANLGDGHQTNHTISGGTNPNQFIADTINYKHVPRKETPPLPTHTIPFLRDPNFIKRSEFEELGQKLSQPGSRVAITGLGGIGKSQFIIEYGYSVRERAPDTWVLWVHASSAARFEQGLHKVAEDVRIPGWNDQNADVLQLVYAWLSDSRRKWLILLDNADDAEFLFEIPQLSGTRAVSRARIDYIPVCAHGSVLVTSRRRAVALRLTDSRNLIELQPQKDHAIALLTSKLEIDIDATLIERLATALEHIPLAIAQAAAYIARRAPRCSVKEYLEKLEKTDKSKTSLLKVQSNELRRDRLEANNSILLTWQISFEHIHSVRTSAADLLSLMSFFDHQGIPDRLVRPVRTETQKTTVQGDRGESDSSSSESSAEDAFELDLDTLRDYSFISVSPDGAILEMHRLVQLAAQLWLKEKAQHQQWEAESVRKLESALPWPDFELWRDCRTLYPHAKLMLDWKLDGDDELRSVATILHKAGQFAQTQGSYAESEAMGRRSVELLTVALGAENEHTLWSEATLGTTLWKLGRFKEAEELQVKVLQTRRRVLGSEEHPDVLRIMADLALTYSEQGRFDEVKVLQVNVMQARMSAHRRMDHPDILSIMNNLALTYAALGLWDGAMALQTNVMECRQKTLGIDHPDTLRSMSNVATTYANKGRLDEAEELESLAMETRRRVLGVEHPDTLASMSNLAMVYIEQRRWEEAEALESKATEARKRVLGIAHPHTLASINNLAAIYSSQDRLAEAEVLEKELVESKIKVLGAEHADTLSSMNNLATTYYAQGRLHEAQDLMERCVETQVQILGATHPNTQRSMSSLGVIRRRLESTTLQETMAPLCPEES